MLPSTKPFEQSIKLSRINNGFGGNPRTFFICPLCEKRVRKIYLRWGSFRCRECAKLNYPSQQTTNNSSRWADRVMNILREDFFIYDNISYAVAQELTPDKPKRMRWNTYYHNLVKLRRAQLGYMEAWANEIGKAFGIPSHDSRAFKELMMRRK